MNSAAFAYALLIPLLCGSEAQMTSLRLVVTEGIDARVRVNASSDSARVAAACLYYIIFDSFQNSF